jgi:nicotinate-nucleotide pyrophosphorylase (carboxylating)
MNASFAVPVVDANAVRAQFGPSLTEAIARNVASMLAEDVGSGDLTAGLIKDSGIFEARIIAREDAVLCGRPWFDEVMHQVDPAIVVTWHKNDGEFVAPNEVLVSIKGPAPSLLTAERSGMNFVQMLSGVATATRRYVDAIAATRAQIVDTRKTIPGLRLAQKYAVCIGGGKNHRLGLYDAILLKENHITALGGVGAAVDATRNQKGARFVQVEVETLEQLKVALDHGASSILLDNFSLDMMRDAVHVNAERAALEASGNVNMDTVVAIAQTGVHRISIGALTKDVRAIDLSMRFI